MSFDPAILFGFRAKIWRIWQSWRYACLYLFVTLLGIAHRATGFVTWTRGALIAATDGFLDEIVETMLSQGTAPTAPTIWTRYNDVRETLFRVLE
jgi:hypothetical protein